MEKLLVVASIVAISFLGGCASDQKDGKVTLENTGAADIHAVTDERLKVVMRRLKSLTFDRYTSALDLEKKQGRYFRELADIAEGAGKTARRLPELGNRLELTLRERKEFLGFANRLVRQADGVKQLADSGRSRALQTAMRNMIATCNSCHDRFRDMRSGNK